MYRDEFSVIAQIDVVYTSIISAKSIHSSNTGQDKITTRVLSQRDEFSMIAHINTVSISTISAKNIYSSDVSRTHHPEVLLKSRGFLRDQN